MAKTLCLLAIIAVATGAATTVGDDARALRNHQLHWPPRPAWVDVPLREANISDEEVRQVQSVVAGIHPGAIVNIGPVVATCPCKEGPDCSAQVWTVAHSDGLYEGLLLSLVNNEWQIGPVQDWYFVYDALTHRMRVAMKSDDSDRFEKYLSLIEEQTFLLENLPRCLAEPNLDATFDRQ